MSANTQQLPSTFESYDQAEENLSWVESNLKSDEIGWSEYGNIVKNYLDVLAKSFSDGKISSPDCDEMYGRIPVKNYPMNRSHIEDWFQSAVDDHGHPKTGSGGTLRWENGKPLNTWIDDNLVSLNVVEYTDMTMKAKHEWLFEYDGKRQVIESQKHHNSPSEFESLIEDNFPFVQVDDPTEEYREGGDWKKLFIRPLKNNDDRVSREIIDGPRTQAIESIKDMLEVRTAYFDIDRANDADGVFIDPVEPDCIFVRSTLIDHKATEHGFENVESIRSELKHKGIVSGSVSEKRRLSDGQNPRWWKLPRDFADVATEEEDSTPAGKERFRIDAESGEDDE